MFFGLLCNMDLGTVEKITGRRYKMARRNRENVGCPGQMSYVEETPEERMRGALERYDALTSATSLGRMLSDEPELGIADSREIVTKACIRSQEL